jgi:hypothetical protein
MSSLVILVIWVVSIYWFHKNTCVMNNHEYKRSRKNYICKKCGLIKKGAVK